MIQWVSMLTVQSQGPEFKSYNGPAQLHKGLEPQCCGEQRHGGQGLPTSNLASGVLIDRFKGLWQSVTEQNM